MSMRRRHARSMRGSGLVEVLIGLFVISVGVAGLARLHLLVMQEGGQGRARSVAVQLARAKLDDLRAHVQREAGGAGVFGHEEIADDRGGAERADGSLLLPAGVVEVDHLQFRRHWQSTAYFFCDGASLAASACDPPQRQADFRQVSVSIDWTDADGSARTITLHALLPSTEPSLDARALLPAGVEMSVAIYADVPAAGGRIDLGHGLFLQPGRPVSLQERHEDGATVLRLRSENLLQDAQGRILERSEFTTLACRCRQRGEIDAFDLQGQLVRKRGGEPVDAGQAFECLSCCRDHHDDLRCDPSSAAGRAFCYDPARPAGDYDAASHDHHHYAEDGTPADAPGSVYVEACRLQRRDGLLHLAQDWQLLRLDIVPRPSATTGGGDDAVYGAYLRQLLASAITGDTLPASPWREPLQLGREGLRVEARAVYLDAPDAVHRAEWAARIRAGDVDWIRQLPVQVLDLSQQVRWHSSAPAVVRVVETADAAAATIVQLRPLATGSATIEARIAHGNAGFVAVPGIGTTDSLASLPVVVP